MSTRAPAAAVVALVLVAGACSTGDAHGPATTSLTTGAAAARSITPSTSADSPRPPGTPSPHPASSPDATQSPDPTHPPTTGDADAGADPAAPAATGEGPASPATGRPTEPLAVDVIADAEEPLRFAPRWMPAADAPALAARIERAETAARAGNADPRVRQAAGFDAQMAYRQLATTPAWFDEVLAALPSDLRRTAAGNVAARDALDRLRATSDPPTALPAWRIVPPAPPTDLLRHYREAAEAVGVEWEYLAAINLVETRMGRIRGVSSAGARGPMQFVPESWGRFGAGGDVDDERDSIFAAARHLRRRGWDDGPRAALYRYNNHEEYVDAVAAYARVLRDDPDAYLTYHGWQVLFTTPRATFLLPIGYHEEDPVPIDQYLTRPVAEVAG